MKYSKLFTALIVTGIMLITMSGCVISRGQPPQKQQSQPAQQQPAAQQTPSQQQGTQQPPVQQQPAQLPPVQQTPPVVEEDEEEDEEEEGELTAIIKSTDDLSIDEGDIYFQGTITIKVSNDTFEDVEDIGLELEIEADEDIPYVSYASLTGDDINWTFDDQDDEVLEFSCSSGIDIDEGDSETYKLTLYIYFDEEVDEDTDFDVSIELTDDANDDDDDVTAVITSTSGLSIYEDESYFSGTIVLKVTNNTDDDVDDVELTLEIEADEDIPDVSSASLTGGDVTWTFDDQDDEVLEFSCSSGLDIDEDDYEKFTLTLYVYFSEEVDEGINFEPSIEVTDYD